MVLLCGYFLYIPPNEITPLYAGFWFIAFYMAFTIFEIPHITWPSDIAHNSVDKTKLYSFKVFAGYCGLTLFYGIPLLPIFKSNEITPETLKITFILAAICTLPLLYLAIKTVPNGRSSGSINRLEQPFSFGSLRSTLKDIAKNKPFFLFVLAFVCAGFASGMWYGLVYIYVDAYLGMGDQFAQLFLIAFIAGLLVTPLWYQLSLKIGKKTTWALAVSLLVTSFILTGMLEPGKNEF